MEQIFIENKIDWVIHLAWLKAVWESCENPNYYYENNILWSINLFKIMDKYNVKNIVFSSSATVYNSTEKLPWNEETYTWNTLNPYWTTKFVIENVLRDLSIYKWFNTVNLRFFNVIWAHKSGIIWEDLEWIPNNLLPYIMKVVTWELDKVKVFWNDYDTKDGTAERDYIHVMDVIEGIVKSWDYIKNNPKWSIFETFNLWNWKAVSVMEIINLTREITWDDIPYIFTPRRHWDLSVFYCNPNKANDLLKWKALYTVKDAIEDTWRFIRMSKKL